MNTCTENRNRKFCETASALERMQVLTNIIENYFKKYDSKNISYQDVLTVRVCEHHKKVG